MAEQLFGFTASQVRRVGRVVQAHERRTPERQDQDTGHGQRPPRFWVELTEEDGSNPGRYKWKLSDYVDHEWTDRTPAISSGADYTAIEANGVSGLEGGRFQVEFYGYDAEGKPRYLFIGGGGGSLPTGQYQHMVYQNVTQNESGFDFVMAHTLP